MTKFYAHISILWEISAFAGMATQALVPFITPKLIMRLCNLLQPKTTGIPLDTMCRNAQKKVFTFNNMYFTQLPNHSTPGFDVPLHFSNFKKHNIIFNAVSKQSHCEEHVGCLSFKTVLSGEEWYGVDNRQISVKPGQFLVLNDDQTYSSRIEHGNTTRVLSVFFKTKFASAVCYDAVVGEDACLDNPFNHGQKPPEFFQTLTNIEPALHQQLMRLLACLEDNAFNTTHMDELLVFLLRYIIGTYKADTALSMQVNAIKPSTKTEIFKRLCVVKDMLHSHYSDSLDLETVGKAACLSVPQLIRQFKTVFGVTPHQYLVNLRLQHAAEQLQHSHTPIQEIAWQCGFENTSAFCRKFKGRYGVRPGDFRG